MTVSDDKMEVTSYSACSQQLLCCSGRCWDPDNFRAAAHKRLTPHLHLNAARCRQLVRRKKSTNTSTCNRTHFIASHCLALEGRVAVDCFELQLMKG